MKSQPRSIDFLFLVCSGCGFTQSEVLGAALLRSLAAWVRNAGLHPSALGAAATEEIASGRKFPPSPRRGRHRGAQKLDHRDSGAEKLDPRGGSAEKLDPRGGGGGRHGAVKKKSQSSW